MSKIDQARIDQDPNTIAIREIVGDLTALIPAWFSVTLNATRVAPGAPISFAWFAGPAAGHRWLSVDLEVTLVHDREEQLLFRRRRLSWPPRVVTLEDTDGIWPPIGSVADVLRPIGGARIALYQGLATKALRFDLFTQNDDGSTTNLSAVEEVAIVASALPVTVVVNAPRSADWNSRYTVYGRISSSSLASVSCEFAVSDSDGTTFPTVTASLEPLGSAEHAIAGPVLQDWRWFDLPSYRVRDDQLRRILTYTPTVSSVRDEFGNAYPSNPQQPATVTITVPRSKITCANLAEANWWLSTGFGVGAAVAGLLSEIPVLGWLAPIAAGAGGIALYFGGIAAMYAQCADDPPWPDPEYWIIESIPMPLPEPATSDEFTGVWAVARSLHRLARCVMALNVAAGKILGARRSGDQLAVKAHLDRAQLVLDTSKEELRTIIESVEAARDEVAGDPALAPEVIAKQQKVLLETGISPRLRDALEKQLGKVYGTAFADLLVRSIPPIDTSLRGVAYLAHESLRITVENLSSILQGGDDGVLVP